MIARLKEVRNEKGLNQKKIAAYLNITQQTYSDYETGRTNPDINTLILISNILETSIDYLLGREDDLGNITIKTEKPAPLPPDTQELVNIYQALSPAHRSQILEYARYFAEKSGAAYPPQSIKTTDYKIIVG